MDCEEFRKCLDNYESLTDNEKLDMNYHASQCEQCAQELDFMLSVIEAVKSLPDIEPPADFMEKLNARIDAEERKKKLTLRMFAGVKRNWKQCTTVAACLALVAVLTANSGILTDRMAGTDDGVIINDTPVSDGAVTPVAPEVAAVVDEPSNHTSIPASFAEAKQARSRTSRVQTAQANTAAQEAEQGTARAEVRSSEPAVNNSSAAEATSRPRAEVRSTPEVYKMASIESPEDGIAAYSGDMPVDDMPAGRSMDGYRLSGEPSMQLAGVDEPVDKDGKAIGQLRIPQKDEVDAMEVIMKYSYEVDGDCFTTSPDNMVQIFSDLVDRGVDYADYTPDYEGTIKFQLVIG